MNDIRYKKIFIEGLIGSGKTSLCYKLEKRLNYKAIYEEFQENPFLNDFYIEFEERDEEIKNYSLILATEIKFLMDRFTQHYINDNQYDFIISDYMPQKSLVFAQYSLEPEYFDVFYDVFNKLEDSFIQPDIIIWLSCSLQQIQRNIKKRGREFEERLPLTYLQMLDINYQLHFENVNHSVPILKIDVSNKDFVANEEDYMAIENLLKYDWNPGINRISI